MISSDFPTAANSFHADCNDDKIKEADKSRIEIGCHFKTAGGRAWISCHFIKSGCVIGLKLFK